MYVHPLNSKESKEILDLLEEQYGLHIDKKTFPYAFLVNKDRRITLISKDIDKIEFDQLRIDAIGVYIGEQYQDQMRLSIEGAQLLGKHATKNIVLLDHDQMIAWVKGNDIAFENTGKDFVIVKYVDPKTQKEDILGCGRFSEREQKLLNFVSKSRRLVVVNE